jgi:hypothetical protein
MFIVCSVEVEAVPAADPTVATVATVATVDAANITVLRVTSMFSSPRAQPASCFNRYSSQSRERRLRATERCASCARYGRESGSVKARRIRQSLADHPSQFSECSVDGRIQAIANEIQDITSAVGAGGSLPPKILINDVQQAGPAP